MLKTCSSHSQLIMSKMKGVGGAAKYKCKDTVRAACDRLGASEERAVWFSARAGEASVRLFLKLKTPELEACGSMFPEELV